MYAFHYFCRPILRQIFATPNAGAKHFEFNRIVRKIFQFEYVERITSVGFGRYAPRYVYVEVFLVEDGRQEIDYYHQYLGTYMLLEQITRLPRQAHDTRIFRQSGLFIVGGAIELM